MTDYPSYRSGRGLYEGLADASKRLNNCNYESWDSLPQEDQDAWNDLSANVNARLPNELEEDE